MSAHRDGLSLIAGQVPFGSTRGLDGVSLHVARGERLALVGPSGAGKTSLLRAIAGLGHLEAGRVTVDGQDVSACAPEARGIVYMHQTPSLFPHLSVVDNVAFPLEVRGLARQAARAEAGTWLARVQLAEFAQRRPSTLSGGQRHRVALARALAARPAALLLDEPFSSLDPSLRDEVRDTVLALLEDRSGPAVVIVTHDLDEALMVGHRIAVLLDRTIAQSGTPAEVFGSPDSVAIARFLGFTNIVFGHRDSNGQVTSPLGQFSAAGLAGPVAIVCRPGDLLVSSADIDGIAGRVLEIIERVHGRMVIVRVGEANLVGMPIEARLQPGLPVRIRFTTDALHVLTVTK